MPVLCLKKEETDKAVSVLAQSHKRHSSDFLFKKIEG
jgi:hypothetical protein